MHCRFAVILIIPSLVSTCNIWGTDSGECSELPLDKIWRLSNMPFCGSVVLYPTCLPKFQTLPPSREYPFGRWFNHTVLTKDKWVEYEAKEHVKYRMRLERNNSLRERGVNEHGDPVVIRRRFWHHEDCRNAYKNYFCWINFPRCDMNRDESMATCRSACENYFISCGLDRDIWRCGPSMYFNGYEPEEGKVNGFGEVNYMRDYFPGQPFRENKFNRQGLHRKICTPAIDGSAFGVDSKMQFAMAFGVSLLSAVIVMVFAGL
mmetsp:Transcript_7136/g.10626  ORF Transcript_7136/g.10626 Transcript_7136/m.10626 type:complete len:262 (-) Transcript_7136:138-923(-)